MSKLRLVTKEEADSDYNIDHDPLIQNTDPYGFMVLESAKVNLVRQVCEIFDLKFRQEGNKFTLTCKGETENYKIDVLTLTTASLWLFNKNPELKVFIGVSQSLRGILVQHDVVKKNLLKGEELELEGFKFSDKNLALTQHAQLTLHQAGIEILTNSKFLEMGAKQIQDLMIHFAKSAQDANTKKLRLVG